MGLPTGRHYLFLSQQSLVIYSPLSWNETPRDFPLLHKNVYMVVAAVLLMCPESCFTAFPVFFPESQYHADFWSSGSYNRFAPASMMFHDAL